MCGIAGYVSLEARDLRAALTAMRVSLRHRGPDASGEVFFDLQGKNTATTETACAALAHTRLSILDLSPAGAQPMANETGDLWITYNGECYNFEDFHQDLRAKGHRFMSRTDTEVLIHLYEEYGLDGLVQRVNGMFAMALWETSRRRLTLVRDRLGKKPLYYMHRPDGSLLFASEIKAFAAAGVLQPQDIDLEALHQFWMYGYAAYDRTIFSSVKKVPPGHYAVWEQGKLAVHEYWDCPFPAEPKRRSLDDFADELEALLCDAIRLRLIADVPVGLFLSGGIDSSLICALAAKIGRDDLQTFTIEFEQSQFNESPYAAAVSRHLGLENMRLLVTDDLRQHFTDVARHFDEPFGDSSSIPTYYVSKLAREQVTVVLTGDAGDELFAGYDAYAKGLRLWGSLRQRLLFSKRVPWQNLLVDAPMMLLPENKRLMELEKVVPDSIRRKILSAAAFQGVNEASLYRRRQHWLAKVDGCDLLSRMQYLDIKSYLPDDILVKVDRMSMAHALECRSPFLDYRVVEFAMQLPYEAKINMRTGVQKLLLRRILSRYVPESLFDRPKAGFCVPWTQWCQGTLGAELRQRWRGVKSPYFNADAAEVLFPRHKPGWMGWQWNAFASLTFFDG